MYAHKIIHQISETSFEVKELSVINENDLKQQTEQLGITYPEFENEERESDYPAGKFVIQWRHRDSRNRFAYIFYINKKKNTKTVIKSYRGVETLEDVAVLMNKYANLTNEETWDLLESVIDKLGMYHHNFIVKRGYEHSVESGYVQDGQNQLDANDYDRRCIIKLKTSMKSAVDFATSARIIYSMATLIKDENDNQPLTNILERLKQSDLKAKELLPELIYNGRQAEHHWIGKYDILKYPIKS